MFLVGSTMHLKLWFHICACVLCLLPSQFDFCVMGYYVDYKVIISDNGPTTLGGITTFDATVLVDPSGVNLRDRNKTTVYTFWWKTEERSDWVKHEPSSHSWDSFRWKWSEKGIKTVYVDVAILVGSEEGHQQQYSVTNNTELVVTENIIASLVATQDSLGKNETNDKGEFHIGQVDLQVSIHDPSNLFDPNNIMCDWDFGDGTWRNNTLLKRLRHNFTEDISSYSVTVNLRGWALGRYYLGTTTKTLKFKDDFEPYLVIKSFPGPKLPPLNPHEVLVAAGLVTFEVKFKDPYHLISEVSTGWQFGDHTRDVSDWKNKTISHIYHVKEKPFILWTTVRIKTKGHLKQSSTLIKTTLHVKAPVKSLNLSYHYLPTEKQVVAFNISCKGSFPVSFCWLVSKSCSLPSSIICSPTFIQNKSCSLLLNHTFSEAGRYCVIVAVANQVSGINTSLTLEIPSGPSPRPGTHNSTKVKVEVIAVGFVLCCLLLGLLLVAVKKLIQRARKKTEKADFDFRDEDTASLSSMNLFGKESCLPRCRLLGCTRRQENIPLLSQAENGNYSEIQRI